MADLTKLLNGIFSRVDLNRANTCTDAPDEGGCPQCVSDPYFDKSRSSSIDYSCEDKRKLYVLRYLPVHMQEVRQVLAGLCSKAAFPKQWPQTVNVLSLGGGPGSDVAGFKKFIADDGFCDSDVTDFHICRLEREAGWDDLAKEVINLHAPNGFTFTHKKHIDDIDALPECIKQQPVGIFLLSYIVSELELSQCNKLGMAIATLADRQAIVVFNDRNQREVVEKIDAICSPLNILDTYKRETEEWVGLHYPDDLAAKVQPKLNMKSYRRGVIIAK